MNEKKMKELKEHYEKVQDYLKNFESAICITPNNLYVYGSTGELIILLLTHMEYDKDFKKLFLQIVKIISNMDPSKKEKN